MNDTNKKQNDVGGSWEEWTDKEIYLLLLTSMTNDVKKEDLTQNEKNQLEIFWNILYAYISTHTPPKHWKMTTKGVFLMMEYIEKVTGLSSLDAEELKKLKIKNL